MKTKQLLILMVFAASFSACRKDSFDRQVVGKWEVEQRFDGYANGGDYRWYTVPAQSRSVIIFYQDSTFSQLNPPIVSSTSPNGTYSITSNSQLILTSSCNCFPSAIGLNFSNGKMVLTFPVREGQVIEQYTRIQ